MFNILRLVASASASSSETNVPPDVVWNVRYGSRIADDSRRYEYLRASSRALSSNRRRLLKKSSAASSFKGSSGFGSFNRDCTLINRYGTVITGLQEPVPCFRMSRHTAPFVDIFGWKIGVRNITRGGLNGYSGGKNMSTQNLPDIYGVCGGPEMIHFQCVSESSSGST